MTESFGNSEGVILKTIITGSIAFDTLMSFPGNFSEQFLPDKLDAISVSFLVDEMKKQRGGCAPNIAYSLALLGERPLVVGTAGRDFAEYRAWLESAGVDTSGIKEVADVYTASFFANTDRKGNQICSFYTGAMRFAKDVSVLPFLSGSPADTLVMVSPNDPEAMARYPEECRRAGVRFAYDPGQQVARLSGGELASGARGAHILIVNEYEFELFKKKTGFDDASLFSVAEIVIVTLGEKGAAIRTASKTVTVPVATPRQVLDPTGVGDAFRAGLLKGIAMGLPWEIAGRMGSAAAAYVLETEGPQSHSYTRAEFASRYCENFGPCEALLSLAA
jgi:adenosine kinase